MLRFLTAVRIMPALWLAIPVSVLAGVYAAIQPIFPPDGYALDATAQGSAILPFVAPFCAACAAWEGSRFRRARLWDGPWVRSRATIIALTLLPIVLSGLLALGTATAMELYRGQSMGLPDLRILGIAALDLLAASVVGFAAGVLLPFAVAGPLVAMGAFAWLAFVPGFEPRWLRHLTGLFRDCCANADDLSDRAVVASLVVNLAFVVSGTVLLLTRPLLSWRTVAAPVILVAAVLVGSSLVAGMSFSPTEPRNPASLACRQSGEITVCLWPEHGKHQTQVLDVASRSIGRWRDAGLTVPTTVTEAAAAVAPRDALVISFSGMRSSTDDIVGSLARSLLPRPPLCAGPDQELPYLGVFALTYLEAWYAAVAGMSPRSLYERYSQLGLDDSNDLVTVVMRLTQSSRDDQLAWEGRLRAATQSCDTWPDLTIGK